MSDPFGRLLRRINRKDWWHVPPVDPHAYSKRGKWLASTFRNAEFYGRPNDCPDKVNVTNPLIGDEEHIHEVLGIPVPPPRCGIEEGWYERMCALDARIAEAATRKGYDSIVWLAPARFKRLLDEGRIPLSMELTLLRGYYAQSGGPRGSRKIGSRSDEC